LKSESLTWLMTGCARAPESFVLLHPENLGVIPRQPLDLDFTLYNLHIPAEHLFIGSDLPRQILRRAVDGRKVVERHEWRVLHENLAGLLKQSNTFFVVGDHLFFVDDFIERRIAVIAAFGRAAAKVLVVKSVGVR
jgi:hypothetical protein